MISRKNKIPVRKRMNAYVLQICGNDNVTINITMFFKKRYSNKINNTKTDYNKYLFNTPRFTVKTSK